MSVSLSIGGVDIVQAMAAGGHSLLLSRIGGRDPVRKEVQSAGRPGSPGRRLIGESLPEREITVSYTLISSSTSERREAGVLLGRLLGHGLQDCGFTDQDGYYRAVVSNEEDSGQYPSYGDGAITLYCPQPFLYGPERTTEPVSGTVSIESNYFVEPVILWTTDQQVGAAWIEVDGKRLTIDTGISAGQQIRIDCARKETRVGGVLNVENIHGTYPRVWDGSTIQTSPGGELSFTYQERHI